MQIDAVSIEDYIAKIPEERQEVFKKIFDTINDNLPAGFNENISYGMVGWDVPLDLSRRISLHSRYSAAVYRFGFTKEFYCILSYGHVCKA